MYIYKNDTFLRFDILSFTKSRKKDFVKDSMSKRKKMSFLFILLP